MKPLSAIGFVSILFLHCQFTLAQKAGTPHGSAPAAAADDAGPSRYALKGTLVTPTDIIDEGTILIVGEKIEAIGKNIKLPPDIKAVETTSFIYPGLIDLHDHITWNFLPRWKPPQKFATRYEWQVRDDYLSALKNPHDSIVPRSRSAKEEDLACDANRFGEVKAIVGGATSVVDSLGKIDSSGKGDVCIKGLARNLDSYSGLYPVGVLENARNEVFPLELTNDDIRDISQGLSDCHHAIVVHLAEGSPNDPSAAREFRMFKARGFLHEGVSIIHGVALKETEFFEMADAHVGLIWSPRSNIELYGGTTNVRAAKADGVKIALAPDWSPTGSDGVLEELNYAADWNAAQSPPVFTEAELVEMVTVRPAELAKLDGKIGSLRPHHFADLLIIRSQETDPYRALVKASPADVRLVMIGGAPVYGDDDLMRSLAPNAHLEPITFCSITKLMNFDIDTSEEGGTRKSWNTTIDALTKALKPWHLTLSELAPCSKDR